MRWLFRGGDVVLSDGVRHADVRVHDGRIAEVGAGLAVGTDQVVDVGGLHVLPGAIDPHGHQWEPGFTPRPDFADVTASAAVGGVTTLLDHPLTPPVVLDRATLAAKADLGERTSLIDFGLHGGAAPDRLDEIEGMWRAGATGIKLFTCPTGTPLDGFDDPAPLEAAMAEVARTGALVLVHAEDAGVLDRAAGAIRARSGGTIADFPGWHTLEAEEQAVERVLDLAERTGASVYLVHASHPDVVDRGRAAATRGVRVVVETCPHYLHLTDKDLRRQGAWAMTAPPVRDAAARDGLRTRVAEGGIDTIGSDHCAIGAAGKSGDRMEAVIPGVPGLDLFLPLLLDLIADHILDLPRLVQLTAETPARIFGLSTKGAIRAGLDADLAICDLSTTQTVQADRLPGSAGWSPYEGRTLRGTVVETWSRGVPVAREGWAIGAPGHGRFLARAGGRHG